MGKVATGDKGEESSSTPSCSHLEELDPFACMPQDKGHRSSEKAPSAPWRCSMEELLKVDLTPAETGLLQGGTPSSFSSDTSVGLGPSKLHSLLSFTAMPQHMALAQPPLLPHRLAPAR